MAYKPNHNKFLVAINGIIKVFKDESSFRYQFIVFIIAILLSVFFNISPFQWILIIISAMIVFVLEIMNTAIENIIDLISPEYNIKAGMIKDISAGAVLVATIGSVIIGMIIFVPKILVFLHII